MVFPHPLGHVSHDSEDDATDEIQILNHEKPSPHRSDVFSLKGFPYLSCVSIAGGSVAGIPTTV